MSDFRWIVEWMHGDDWKPFAGANHDYHAQVFCDYAKQNGLVARLRDTRLDAPKVEVPTLPLDADAVRKTVQEAVRAERKSLLNDLLNAVYSIPHFEMIPPREALAMVIREAMRKGAMP